MYVVSFMSCHKMFSFMFIYIYVSFSLFFFFNLICDEQFGASRLNIRR